MLDHLRLSIPVLPIYAVERGKGMFYFEGDLLSLGLKCSCREVKRNDNGEIKAYDLYAPFESLGTDYSDMAVKFYDKSKNCLPYLEIKASPAKLLQGHNVYGGESIEEGANEMLGMVMMAFPELSYYLDFARTEVMHLDCTYSARLPSQSMVQPVLDYFCNISAKWAKSNPSVVYNNYVYWGNKDSRYIGRKAYGKLEEVKAQIDTLINKKILTDQEMKKFEAMQKALPFADGLLRFEARICKQYLNRYNYPTNLYALINLQRQNQGLLREFWGRAFKSIFDALKGEHMPFDDDDSIYKLLKSRLFTLTKKGNISYTRADNAYQFYKVLKADGFNATKKRLQERTFYNRVALLLEAGISKSHLQNLHVNKSKVIPMHRLVELDFNSQCPADYVPPVSQFTKLNQLRLVA